MDKEGKNEYKKQWLCLSSQVARPTTAFIVVDVQNDFISGSLAISNCPAGQNGEDVSFEKLSYNLYFELYKILSKRYEYQLFDRLGSRF